MRLLIKTSFAVLCGIAPFSCLAGSWRSYFSLVVVDACKPRFFHGTSRLERVEGAGQGAWRGGSQSSLTALLGVPPHSILYAGDHLYADIIQLGKHCDWRSLLVVPELQTAAAAAALFRCRGRLSHFGAGAAGWADLYTASVSNLHNYQPNHRFVCKAQSLPHDAAKDRD